MGNLRRNYNRFLNRNRNKGIPRLMLYIGIGNLLVYFFSAFNSKMPLYQFLSFDAEAICHGQVWRLLTYVFTFTSGYGGMFGLFFALLAVYFYYWLGTMLENVWGTFKFNLYYFCGVLIMDIAGILLYLIFRVPSQLTPVSVDYVNLSLFLAVATLIPEQRVLLFMIIPIKMKWMAVVDLGLTLYGIVRGLIGAAQLWAVYGSFLGLAFTIFALFPLLALLNYFLFFGRSVKNLLPNRVQHRGGFQKQRRRTEFRRTAEPQPNPNWAKNYRSSTGERPYRHKCTVCGRTDTDCPDLEFRYCSKCKGYFCYCIDHINNHTHVQ